MPTLTLNVKELHQMTGAFEHVVIFDATIHLVAGDSGVYLEFAGVPFQQPDDQKLSQIALDNIREGVQAVLEAEGLGALVEVTSLVIHPTDFQERMFKKYTVKYLNRTLAALKTSPAD